MPAETNTSHTGKRCEKPCRSTYTRGCASVPPRNSTATRREERPISKHQPLRVPNGYHRRGSGATVGDSHKGLLITGENPISSQNNKNANESRIVNYTSCNHGLVTGAHGPGNLSGPSTGQPRHPSGKTPPRSRAWCRTTKTPPHSRAGRPLGRNPALLEGWTPPRAKLCLARGLDAPSGETPPRSGARHPSGETPPRLRAGRPLERNSASIEALVGPPPP
jgi:hypothetical protein